MARPSPALTCITMVQVLCSICIIAITSNRITHPGFGTQKRCYLSADPYNTSPCSLAYAAAGVSLATAVLAGCLKCCSFNCCGLGPIQSIVLAAFNCIWWLIMSSILTAAAVAADAAGLPASDARHLVLTAAWIAVLAELLHSLAACLVVGNNVCNILFCVDEVPEGEDCCDSCCGGCCRRRHSRRRARHGVQAPLLPAAAGAAAAAAATSAMINQTWWQRVQLRPQQPQARPVNAVVTVHQGVTRPVAGGYMPPPPTAGQPYLVPSAQAAWAPPPPPAAAGAPDLGSFGGFPPQHAAAGGASAAGTPALAYGLAQIVDAQPSAPFVPAQQQQQQQQLYTPPVVVQQMDAGQDLYPSIPKQ